ncbi:phospholipase-like protein [Tanacetum coccineum]
MCKAIFTNDEAPRDETSSNGTNKLYGVSFIYDDNEQVSMKTDEGPSKVLPCQLPPKELSPGSFTLPCTIGSLNFYVMADLGSSVSIMRKLMFNHLKLTNLKKTNMLVEMADITKKGPYRNSGKHLYHSLLLFMLEYVFDREISLRVGEDRIVVDINGNVHHLNVLVEKVCMINEI